jgi:23S rRNA pseudouridine1911/1915/1917 synthase
MDASVIDVGEAQPGQRLDRYLADRLGVSRARIRHLLDHGRIRSGDAVLRLADKSRPVVAGERFALDGSWRAEDEQPRPRPDLELDVRAAGEGWVVVAKPAGRGVHPLDPDQDDTVLNALCARHPEILGVGEGGLRSGVVHRLDVDTSGALLFATTDAAWRRLRGAFSDHRIVKRYRAIVEGELARERRLDLPLEIACHRPARVRVRAGGRLCRAHVRPLERLREATLVEVALETGFLHQIRVSLAHLGHPIVGDSVYGNGEGAARPMLHARTLRLDEIDVTVEPPDDFQALLEHLSSTDRASD